MNYKTFFIAFLLTFAIAGDAATKPNLKTLKPHNIAVSSEVISFDRIDPGKKDFGRLKWRGGLVLASKAREFGGYSGLAVTDRGARLIAVSDQGTWLTADLQYDNGHLDGLANIRIGPLRARNGKNLRRKKFADAEEISLWKKGGRTYALIAFERKHRIGRFPLKKNGLSKPLNYLKLPKGVFKTTRNKGIEALTVLNDKKNKGTVLTFLERRHDKNGNHRGWLIRGNKSWPVRLKARDGFDITGLATLANGNVLVLERSFGLLSGIQMRIREIPHQEIRKKAVLDGEILIRATMRYNIDNMEGISAHTSKQGEQIITLISDNNFNTSGLQRTLLMQFRLD